MTSHSKSYESKEHRPFSAHSTKINNAEKSFFQLEGMPADTGGSTVHIPTENVPVESPLMEDFFLY